MDLELAGKTALVTGGSRGIGKAVARQLAMEGVDVALAARDLATLQATAKELEEETGRRFLILTVETSSDDSVKSMVKQALDAFGHIDILVNAAAQAGGQAPPPKLQEITDDLFWGDVNVKVMGYLRTAREVAPQMIQRGWGRIINISGLAARGTGSTIGSIRNVGVSALTKNLADELGPHGINVTVVHPGLTRTEKTPEVIARQAQARGVSPAEVEQGMAQGNTVKKIIDARDIAYVVAFLASPRSLAINGDAVAAGGGTPRSIHY